MGLYLSVYIITSSIDRIDLHSTDAPSYSNAVLPTDTVETPASDRQPCLLQPPQRRSGLPWPSASLVDVLRAG